MAEMDSGNVSIKIDIRDDGVYCIIDRSEPVSPVSRTKLIDIIESNQIKDVDYSIVNSIFKDTRPHIEVKLSSNSHLSQIDERIDITTSRDKMEAYVTLMPPGINGKRLTATDILNNLESLNIKYGIDKNAVNDIVEDRLYHIKRVVARGTPPIDGKDGYVEYLFDKEATNHKPKVMDDGTVDFHDLNIFIAIHRGQELVKIHPAIEGVEGTNVFGEAVHFKVGKPPAKVPRGKNVRLSDDELTLFSETDGHLELNDGKVSVSPVLEIKSDVGTATGDINFNGAVIVRGGVMSGYSVTATGDVEVYGPVEAATIRSSGDIVLYKGIQGAEKAVISADGNLIVNFAEKASLTCGGNIFANAILHCNVKCYGELRVEGKKGALVGGNVQVGQSITASVIGSHMAAPTNISVGNSPNVVEGLDKLTESLNQALSEFDKIKVVVEGLMKLNDQGKLNDQKKNLLVKAMQEKIRYRSKITALKEKIDDLNGKLTGDTGFVNVKKRVFLGVKIAIGHASIYIDEEMDAKVFKNVEGQIMILSEQSLK